MAKLQEKQQSTDLRKDGPGTFIVEIDGPALVASSDTEKIADMLFAEIRDVLGAKGSLALTKCEDRYGFATEQGTYKMLARVPSDDLRTVAYHFYKLEDPS